MKAGENTYHGARFFKCDLQMHTPAQATHWRGPAMDQSEAGKRAAAEAYIRRCYEVGLEVVGITDHNFASKDFIPLLRDAIAHQSREHGYEIVLFRGFELTADVGKGMHVLALFEPSADLEDLDHILTECGVPFPRFEDGRPRASTKRLPEILEIVQRRRPDGSLRGIVILPHAIRDVGIFDTDRIADWLQAEEYCNPELLAIEVPKSPETMSAAWQRLLGSVPDCDPAWRRVRPIACILSSDAKALRPEDGAENYIGFRHTWIKMSRPSIEALRQAFLDPASRIRFGEKRPEEAYVHPKVRALSVNGAVFLADQTIAFSPNLTCLIGGRGTGKSTLIEYLRVGLGQDAVIQGEDARKNFQRLRQSIVANTLLSVALEKEGQALQVESSAGNPPSVTAGPSAPDLPRFFPVRILSQKEIYAIAEDRSARLRLVDDLVRRELDELGRREQDLLSEIRSLNQQIASLGELKRREKELETERRDFEVKLGRLKTLEEPLGRWKARLAEERFFTDLPQEASEIARHLREVIDSVELRATTIGDELAQTPSADAVRRVAEAADRLTDELKRKVQGAVQAFEEGMKALLHAPDVAAWRKTIETERAEFERRRTELQVQGIDPDQYLDYQRALRERGVQLDELRKRIAAVEALRAKRDGAAAPDRSHQPGLIDALFEIWRAQTTWRSKAAECLADGVPTTSTGDPFVKVTVTPFGDDKAFGEKMREGIRDRRRMSDPDWDEFMQAAFRAAHSSGRMPLLPTALLARWVTMLRNSQRPQGCPWSLNDRRLQVLLEWLTDERLEELRLWRTPDRITIELFRQDGSRVGDLDEAVSVGQRCTAILALLLASGDTPIVIDQPEEDLDNEFVFRELVPLLRDVKERRQIIVATHNANIPVNADSELVVALEVRKGQGQVMQVGGETAIGALDRAAVKRAVEDIMEGSEEAFRRRFEKYGF